ncbi:MAG: dihydrodipicolinate synthase family protein [Promethearchaeota archaeon]|nr:MAG: dihydrodipicolinate synthase family protein [Candidatus Lokiarchaeota archaeon]
MQIKGIIPACITTFYENGEIDYSSMETHLEFLIKNGIKSILILGSTGEFAYLTFNEKTELIKRVGQFISEKHPDIKYYVGISSTNTKESIELGKMAEDNRANCVMATIPTYFPLEKDQIINFYTEIADNLKIPVVGYNFPMTTHIDLTPEILVELAEQGSIIGVKETNVPLNTIDELLQSVPSGFSTIIGTDGMLKGALDLGIKAAILGSGNYIPGDLVKFIKDYEENKEDIVNLWKSISKKMRVLTYGINTIPAIIKYALITLGNPIPPYVRSPLPQISEKLKKKIEKLLK